MASVTAFDAKNRLGQLLDRVESGEEITITRHGEPVAVLVPLRARNGNTKNNALKTFQAVRESLRQRGVKFSRAAIRRLIDEGRR